MWYITELTSVGYIGEYQCPTEIAYKSKLQQLLNDGWTIIEEVESKVKQNKVAVVYKERLVEG